MLIISPPGESFWIGSDTEVFILESSTGHVRVGIAAPRDVEVLRTELIPPEELVDSE